MLRSNIQDQESPLLGVVNAILGCDSLDDLFRELAGRMSRLVSLDGFALLLYDEAAQRIRLAGGYNSRGLAAPVGRQWSLDESPAGIAIREQRLVHVPNVETEERYPVILALLRGQGVRAVCYVPLTTATRKLGALAMASCDVSSYSDAELDLLQTAVKPVALAVEIMLAREQLARERDHLRLMLEVSQAAAGTLDLRLLFGQISGHLRRMAPHDYIGLALWEYAGGPLRLRVEAPAPGSSDPPGNGAFDVSGPCADALSRGRPYVCAGGDATQQDGLMARLTGKGYRSAAVVPLRTTRQPLGVLILASAAEETFRQEILDLLERLAAQMSTAVEGALAFEQVQALNRQLKAEKLYLEEELRETAAFEDILGSSNGIRKVIEQIGTVAATDTTVLIQGETGTGKELVARALHQRSRRGQATFVKLNCAAIPTGLLESELFGHERGAFTGAIAQKTGRFELAHRGTLFLDEIGEIPLELQPKLLRVLQEKEFERLGSNRTQRSDVRLIAATNRDLKKMVEAGQFRGDLYYRLHVFPITVPPLRVRKEDIPILAMHFTDEYARRLGRRIRSIPSESMTRLVAYPWPGNIRELQNFIERSVLLTNGDTLRIPADELRPPGGEAATGGTTLEEVEREAILRAIGESNGVIGGPRGAAARLGMKRTTLLSRMEKLGIRGR